MLKGSWKLINSGRRRLGRGEFWLLSGNTFTPESSWTLIFFVTFHTDAFIFLRTSSPPLTDTPQRSLQTGH